MAGRTIDGIEALADYQGLKPLFDAKPEFAQVFDSLVAELENGRAICAKETTSNGLKKCIEKEFKILQKQAKDNEIFNALVAALRRWWRDVSTCSNEKDEKLVSCTEGAVDKLFS